MVVVSDPAVLGEYMIERILDLYSSASVFAPAWAMFGIIWLIEVIVTVAVLSVLTRRRERAHGKEIKVLQG